MKALHESVASKRCIKALHQSVASKRCVKALCQSVKASKRQGISVAEFDNQICTIFEWILSEVFFPLPYGTTAFQAADDLQSACYTRCFELLVDHHSLEFTTVGTHVPTMFQQVHLCQNHVPQFHLLHCLVVNLFLWVAYSPVRKYYTTP
jgi:hypothetical protein